MNQTRMKPLPSNEEAEASVLGTILMDGKIIFKAMGVVADKDFYSNKNRLIFQAMTELARGEKPLDILTVADHLRRKDQLDDCGGMEYLTQIEEAVPTTQALTSHCQAVQEKSTLRRLIKAGQALFEGAWNGTEAPKDVIETAQNELYGLSLGMAGGGSAKHVYAPDEWAQSAFDLASDWAENPAAIRGIETGFPGLDLAVKGLKDLTIISGSTGMGKTAVGLNMAINIGIWQKIPTLYLNFEMARDELALRVLGILSQIPTSTIFAARYNAKYQFSKIGKAAEAIKSGKLFLTGNEPKNINTTISLIHQHVAQHGVRVVFVDYLGEIEPDALSEKENSEYRTFGRWVQMLKNICVSLGVKLVLLAQLNRHGEETPKMSMVGGSWKIAQKADTFLIIKKENKMDFLHVSKNRNGMEKFDIEINFDRETQRVTEI